MGNPVAETRDPGSCDKGSKEQPGQETELDPARMDKKETPRPESSLPMSTTSPQSRSKDRTHNPKGQTWTVLCDSDLPSDVSVEIASHLGCWLIPITVEGIRALALIDRGASVSMTGRPLYKKVQQISRLCLQTQEMPWPEGVGSNPVPTLCHAEV